jgi:hypothetical protein
MAAKLLGQIAGLAPKANKLDHLLAKFGRVSPSSLVHF